MAEGLEFVNSYPPVLANADEKFGKPVMRLPHGANSVTYKVQQSTGQTLSSGTQYQINVSQGQMVSNYLLEQATIQYQVTVNNGSANAYVPTLETLTAPNFMPLLMNSTMLQVTLNGQSFTINPQNFCNQILAFNKLPDMSEYDLSICPNQLDIFSTYPANPATGNPVYGSVAGTIKNPFGDFSTATYGNSGRWTQVSNVTINPALASIATGANQTYTITFTVIEPLLNQTTAMTAESARAWANLNTLQVTRNFLTSGDVNTRLIKVINTPIAGVTQTVTAGSVQIAPGTSPNLYYTVYTVDEGFNVPKASKYPLCSYQPLYPSNPIQVNAAAVQSFTSPSIPLQYVPACIYVFCARTASAVNLAYASEAPGFQITQLSMDYVTSGNFASASPVVLYQEFGANQGLQKSWAESGNVLIQGVNVGAYGTVYRIDGSQLPIDWQKYSVGSPYKQQLQFTVQGTALRTDTFQLYVQVCDSGYYELSGVDCVSRIGIANPEIVAKCRAQDKNFEAHHPTFGGALSHAMRRVHHGFKKAMAGVHHKLVPAHKGGKVHHRRKVHHKRRRGHGEVDNKECGCDYNEHCDDCEEFCDECNNHNESESELSEYEEPIKKGGRAITKSMIAKRLNY